MSEYTAEQEEMFPEGVSEDILDEPSPLEKVLQDEEPVEAQASEEAPEQEQVDWKARAEEAERERNGILEDLKKYRTRSQQEAAQKERLIESLSALDQKVESLRQPQPVEDETSDPFETQERMLERVAQQTQQRFDSLEQRLSAQDMTNRIVQVAKAVEAREAPFREEHPDYDEAVNFAQRQFLQMYQAQGMTQAEAAQRLQQEKVQMAMQIASTGGDVVEHVYGLAKQLGFKPSETPAPSGEQETPVEAKPPVRRDKPVSLSNVAGGSGGRKISLETLYKDDPKKFEKLANDPDAWEEYAAQLFE